MACDGGLPIAAASTLLPDLLGLNLSLLGSLFASRFRCTQCPLLRCPKLSDSCLARCKQCVEQLSRPSRALIHSLEICRGGTAPEIRGEIGVASQHRELVKARTRPCTSQSCLITRATGDTSISIIIGSLGRLG